MLHFGGEKAQQIIPDKEKKKKKRYADFSPFEKILIFLTFTMNNMLAKITYAEFTTRCEIPT